MLLLHTNFSFPPDFLENVVNNFQSTVIKTTWDENEPTKFVWRSLKHNIIYIAACLVCQILYVKRKQFTLMVENINFREWLISHVPRVINYRFNKSYIKIHKLLIGTDWTYFQLAQFRSSHLSSFGLYSFYQYRSTTTYY